MRFPALVWLFQVYFRMKAAWQKQLGVNLQNSPGSWQSLWSPLAKIYIFFGRATEKLWWRIDGLYTPLPIFLKAPIGAFLGVLQSAVACDGTRNLFLYKKSFDSSHELRLRKTSPTCHVVTLAPRLHPAPPRLQESSGSTAK